MKSIRILIPLILATSIVTPTHAISYHEWQAVTGIGTISGAVAGVMIYNAFTEKKQRKQPRPNTLVIGQKEQNKPKKSKIRSMVSAIGSGALGAATAALAVGWWLWSYTAHARQAHAQGLVQISEQNPFIAQEINVVNQPAVEGAIQLNYARYGGRFASAEHDMNTHRINLIEAQALCQQAIPDAGGDAALIGAIGNTQARIADLLPRVNARAAAIRNNPAYLAEQAAAAQVRVDQAAIEREYNRAYARNYWYGWNYYRYPRPRYVFIDPIFLPAPVYAPAPIVVHHQPVIHLQVHQPGPHYGSAPSYHAPRPGHAPSAPIAQNYGAPMPAAQKRLLDQALGRQRHQFPASQAPHVRPMTPKQAFNGRFNPF